MRTKILAHLFCILFIVMQCPYSLAQDKRTQYPNFLSKSYFSVNIGYINYPFSRAQMEPGYTAESIHIPHASVKIILLGYRINKNLSAQITYLRPVNWVQYKNINGDKKRHSVYMNVGGLTLKPHGSLTKKISVYGEAGLAIVTRNGFEINNIPVVKDANFASVLFGGGFQYDLNNKWSLVAGFNYSPESKKVRQPHTIFYSGGFIFNMNPLPAARVEENAKSGYIFPKNLVQVGYATNALGYGANKFVSEGVIPIFWGGDVEIRKGLFLRYQRNVFHTRKVFALDVGASFGYWKSRKMGSGFFTFSAFPIFRFTALHTKPADVYLFYSVAGPTYISKVVIDKLETGTKFTFQDLMGIGIFAGKKRNLNAEINIDHYSNGNIFPNNPGLKIPLTFSVGYAF